MTQDEFRKDESPESAIPAPSASREILHDWNLIFNHATPQELNSARDWHKQANTKTNVHKTSHVRSVDKEK